MKNFKKIFNPDKLSTLLLYTSILTFIIAFNFAHNPPSGWYQQFMPNLNGRAISDIKFLDSLTGYAVTNNLSPGDTGYILKTTNGGDNWGFSFIVNRGFTAIDFVNLNTGYACGGSSGGTTYLCKTTNSGLNWFSVNCPSAARWEDMTVLNNDTIWLVDSDGLTGGVFRTTNEGINWIRQFGGLSNQNPDKIYMLNSRIGFITRNIGPRILRKTTDGGFNWFPVLNEGFIDMYFIDSLTGWKAYGGVKKTTDGGLSWINQPLPSGGNIILSQIKKFAIVNKDTVWGVGGYVQYQGIGFRGMIYRTTNGGDNWLYQVPDTSINIGAYSHINFYNELTGWAYSGSAGIHTLTGGDSIFYPLVNINQTGSEIPEDFKLSQNYPNPFNPTTSIVFRIKSSKIIKLLVYDISGREISVLVNEKLNAGEYQYVFDASLLSSGIYFYSLFVDEKLIDTKKMVLVR